MELPALPPVIDLDELRLLEEDEEYRDSYLESSVQIGIGSQIRAIREQRGLTQRDLGALAGTTQSTISRLEDESYGRVTVQTLLSIAKATVTALIVRFAPYDEFLLFAKNLSPAALQVPTIGDSIKKIESHQQTVQLFNSSATLFQMITPPTSPPTGIYAAIGAFIPTGVIDDRSIATIKGEIPETAIPLIPTTGVSA